MDRGGLRRRLPGRAAALPPAHRRRPAPARGTQSQILALGRMLVSPDRIPDMTPITGSIVALVTPMHDDGSVDYPTLRKLVDWHIAEGTDCVAVVGTTGESPTVSVQEHQEIIRVAVEQANKRVPI